ncbi:MAG: diaminopimelate decarboxylase [Planctomycetota bacterium]
MDHFEFRDGLLHCESADVRTLAEDFGTPLYVYSRRTLLDHFDRFRAAFAPLDATICFSVKSCQNLAILRLLRKRGAAFDVVSGGELRRVFEAGGDPARVVFAGVGKTDDEIRAALEAGIGWFNVESEAEMDNLATIAASMGRTARAALRVNPDVDPHTHVYTTTGKRETKFGVDLERARRVFDDFRGRPGLDLSAIHLHIGSPVNSVEPYFEALLKALTLIDSIRADGHTIRAINLGGGFGAHYAGSEAPPAAEYAEKLVPLLDDCNLQVLLEPGRSIAANAGILLTRVLYTKASGDRQFVIVDAAITELIRPALYGSFHFAWPAQPRNGMVPPARRADLRLPGSVLVDIVGPVCESGDFLAKDRWLPPVERGDLICVFSTGAYGFVMSSQYNSRPRSAEVLVEGGTVRLIRRRETYDDLVAAERV